MIHLDAIKTRLHSRESLVQKVNEWKGEGQSVAFTNGCFDILHQGHLDYLSKAADFANKLVVGVNSDQSVRQLNKGENRPIQNEQSRALLIASLSFVDGVTIFSEDTPLELITLLKPDVIVKGADWQPDEVVGANVVKGYGGRVELVEFLEGFSTTAIENRIKNG